MTRRIIKNGEKLDTDANNCISNIVPVDPDDIDEITNSLKMILMDNTLRQKLIEEGIAQLEKYNSNDNIKR